MEKEALETFYISDRGKNGASHITLIFNLKAEE